MKLMYKLLLFTLIFAPLLATSKTSDNPETKVIAKTIADQLPKIHLNRLDFNDYIATNALHVFIDSLDYRHNYFLQSDIENFEAKALQMDDQLKNGNVDLAFEIYDTFLDRVSNRVDYVSTLTAQGFDKNVDESFVWKRDDAPFAKNEAEWNEIWRKQIKSEYINRIIRKQLDEEEAAKKAKENTANGNSAAEEGEKISDELAENINLTPSEFIEKFYNQYLSMLQDNDDEWVLEQYINAFTKVYDPHTSWMSPTTAEDFRISMRLALVGIGAVLRSEDGMAKIVQVMPGGPADTDGRLKAGDKIIAVAQGDEEPVDILHWPLNKAVKIIRGKKGTEVVLSVIPADDVTGTRVKKINLVRDEVKLEEQAAKSKIYEVDGYKLGVVTLPDFYLDMEAARLNPNEARSSSRDVKAEVDKMVKAGAKGIILDIRNNGGGALDEAIKITGHFITSGPVVQVKSRHWGIKVLSDTDPAVAYKGPLVVLVNHLSASASEIVAAALQDYGRAVIIGDSQTHGKGTVQTVIPLIQEFEDKYGSLKITTASFYRIAGGSTQLKGVTPDIIIPSAFDALEIGENTLPHALEWSTVGRAWFRRDRKISSFVPTLRSLSEKRRTENSDFATYLEQIERSNERINSGEISLNFDKRIQQVRDDEELEEQQSTAQMPMADDVDEDKEDLVLDEGLNVLIDLIKAEQGKLALK